MELRDYQNILNSMERTGVYVIRADDHALLYCNRRVQEAVPEVRLGMPCHEVLSSSCPFCPLLSIGERKENHTISYNPRFGGMVDISAHPTLWEGQIPAFVLTINPHQESTSYSYRKVLRVDLAQGQYELIKISSGELPLQGRSGILSHWLDNAITNELIHPDDANRLTEFLRPEHLRNIVGKESDVRGCIYRRRRNNGYRWTLVELVPDSDCSVSDRHALLLVKDVHDLLRNGLELEEFNIRQQEVIRSLGKQNFAIYTIDLNTGAASTVCEDEQMRDEPDRLALPWAQVIEHQLLPRLHSEDRAQFCEIFSLTSLRSARCRGEKKLELLCRWITGESSRYVTVYAFCGQNQGSRSYTVLAIRDADDQVRKELEHLHSLQDRAYIISSLSSMFCSTYYMDLEENTFQVVTQMTRTGTILGDKVSCTSALQVYAENFVHPDDRADYLSVMGTDHLRRTLGWWHPYEVFEYRKLPAGDLYDPEQQGWIRATAVLARSDTEGRPKIVLCVAQDVTETKRKQAREQLALREACTLASQASATKSEFLSRMSHDMRTPLNGIIGEAAIASSYLQDPERLRNCLNKILQSGRRLLTLVNGVLDMGHFETEHTDMEEECSLSALMVTLADCVRSTAQSKGIRVHLDFVRMEHDRVRANLSLLKLIFDNILDNSQKFTPEGGWISLAASEKEVRESSYSRYEFQFCDSGVGMDEEQLCHIFEPFYRGDTEQAGAGLGLTTAQNIVHAMGGSIGVKSAPGAGSTFTVSLFLPHSKAEAEYDPQSAPSGGDGQRSFRGCRILLVEDNEINQEIALEFIGNTGAEVDCVENGQEALERFAAREAGYYDLIFMDIQMPVMDGYAATRAIRSLPREDAATIPIVALSANSSAADTIASRDAGMNDHLNKPLDVPRLMACMNAWIPPAAGGSEP